MKLELKPRPGTRLHAMYRRAGAMRGLLHASFPLCFMDHNQPKLPLKIGIHLDIIPIIPEERRYDLYNALVDYCNRMPFLELGLGKVRILTQQASYLHCLIEGAVRIDLNGDPAGVVNAECAARARKLIKGLKKYQAATQGQSNGRSNRSGKSDPSNAAGSSKADIRNGSGIGRRSYHDGPADDSSGHAPGAAPVHRVAAEARHGDAVQ